MNKINIAIAGLGTVGSEVAKQLQINNEFLSKKAGRKLNLIAVSAKDKSKNRGFDQSKLNWFEDATDIASLNEVDLVVELIGGSDGVPLELCKNSLINGKSVVIPIYESFDFDDEGKAIYVQWYCDWTASISSLE